MAARRRSQRVVGVAAVAPRGYCIPRAFSARPAMQRSKSARFFSLSDEESVDPRVLVYDSSTVYSVHAEPRTRVKQAAVVAASSRSSRAESDIFCRIARAVSVPRSPRRARLSSALSSKLGPIAMTSPVAFICVPSVRSGVAEFIERPFREFDDDVVERRLEAGAGLAGDVVFDLVERVAERDLRRDLGDRVAGRLARRAPRNATRAG